MSLFLSHFYIRKDSEFHISLDFYTVILGFGHLFFQTTPPAWQQSKSRKKNEFVKANDKEIYNPPPLKFGKNGKHSLSGGDQEMPKALLNL